MLAIHKSDSELQRLDYFQLVYLKIQNMTIQLVFVNPVANKELSKHHKILESMKQ